MSSGTVMTDGETLHGRNTVMSRAIRRIVSAVTAEALDVPLSQVGVELTDTGGALAVMVNAPVRIAALATAPAHRGESTLLDHAASAQRSIAAKLAEHTGMTVERVELRLSAVRIEQERRVK